jgi:hypothetical protein
MKSILLKLIAISISILCVLSIGLVSALNPDEAFVSLAWSSQTYYQGDSVVVRITFQSNSPDELQIYRIGMQFDWMPSDAFYGRDLSATPIRISSYGNYTFDLMTVSTPLGVTVGSHSYFVGVDGLQNNIAFTWDSPPSTIQIHDAKEKIYTELVLQVASKIDEAVNATYGSTEAQSLLQQAKDEYALAKSLANEGKWQEAMSSLQNTSNYLEQAADAEEKRSAEQPNLLLYAGIVAIGVIIAVSIIVAIRRKKAKAKQTNSAVEQTLETSL